MKLTEVKNIIAATATKNTEAFQQIVTKISALQQQIADLVANVQDPEITDPTFLAKLQELQTTADQLGALATGATPTEAPTV